MRLTIKDIFILGFRDVYYNMKFIVLIWAANAVSALLLSIPIYYALEDNLGHSLLSDEIALKFDYLWFLQFENIYKTNIGEIHLFVYGMVGVYILIQTFFLGGIISIFHNKNKNHMVDFFFGGVKYWLRFTKVLLISLIFFALAFKLNDLLGGWITWIFNDKESAWGDFSLRSLRYILLIFNIGAITIISDYTKIALAVNDRTKIFLEIKRTLIFIKNNFNTVFIAFFLVALIGAVGSIIYNYIDLTIPKAPFYFLFLTFILQQMLIIFRLCNRMFFYATEVIIYKDLNAEIISKN